MSERFPALPKQVNRTMRYFMEHLAVAFGAATGVLAGRGKQIDLFGVIVLGFVTAAGGGTLRDLLLDVPVFWLQDSQFIGTGVLSATAMFFALRLFRPPSGFLQMGDALFLGFLVMLGTAKTYYLGHSWQVCVVMGMITGVAGGIVRDVLCGQIPLVFRTHIELYATAALAGALVFLLHKSFAPQDSLPLVTGAGTTIGLRLAAIRWQIRLPELKGVDGSES